MASVRSPSSIAPVAFSHVMSHLKLETCFLPSRGPRNLEKSECVESQNEALPRARLVCGLVALAAFFGLGPTAVIVTNKKDNISGPRLALLDKVSRCFPIFHFLGCSIRNSDRASLLKWLPFQLRKTKGPHAMKIDILKTQSGITKLVLSGQMDIKGATAADMTFSVAAGANKRVVVDLSSVTFMASLGLRTLMVSAKSMANKGGKMVLLNPQPDVEKVLQTAGISTEIPIVRDMESASTLLNA